MTDSVIKLFPLAFLLFLSPFVTIHCVNHLFGLEIPYTFFTWVATVWLIFVVRGD